VVIDAFKGFTAQEFEIINQIMCQADDVYITLTTDNIFGSDDGTDLFSCVNQTAKKLLSIAKENNVRVSNEIKLPLDNPLRYNNDPLTHLEQNVFNPAFDVFETSTEQITLCCASSMAQECDFVASNAKRLMRDSGLRCREIAVIARDSNLYKRELISSFKKYGIPFFEDERQPITSQPLITLVRCAFEIAAKGFSTDRLMRYLKTGLAGICDEDISVAENYALMWKIGAQDWKSEWTQHPDGFRASVSEKSTQSLAKLNEIRREAVNPLLKFKSSCTDTNGEGIARAVFDLLCEIDAGESLKNLAVIYEQNGNLALALEQERVWEMLMEILDQIATSISKTNIGISRCAELFDSVLSVFDIGSIPQGIDEITIGSADRIRLSSPKVVFIVGANEGIFPQSPDGKGILSDADRRKLIELGVEVSMPSEFKVSEERFIAYNSLCSATDKLFVSYSRCTPSGEVLSPSVIVSQLEQIFPCCSMVNTDELDTLDFIESEKSAFEACAKLFNTDSEASATLKKFIKDNKAYGKRFFSLEKVNNKEPFKFDNSQNAVELFGNDLYVSASQIENYHECPFQYFCRYGVRAKPRKIAELNPMESGTVIHYVLENIIKTYGVEQLCSMSKMQRKSEVQLLLTKYLEENMGGLAEKSKRFEYLYFRLCATLCDVLERMSEEFKTSQFKPVDFELKINNDGDIKPYSLKLPDGSELKIIGSIDRVDIFKKDEKSYIRVVDYKSGIKEFLLSDVFFGLNMQMLIYLFSVYQNGKEYYGDIVPSGILYYPAKLNVSKLPRQSSDDDINEKKIKDGKCNGMLLENMDVLNAMENNLCGRFMPVYLDKKGNLCGSLISFKKLTKLQENVDEILCEMANALHKGQIDAYPAVGKNYKNTCDYCDYISVCGIEPADKVHELDDLKHDDALNLLSGGDDDEQTMD
ncbi:MAG: PD-(D/E)XK nuclease family protein, partial [Oscillospiraceae bacterium]